MSCVVVVLAPGRRWMCGRHIESLLLAARVWFHGLERPYHNQRNLLGRSMRLPSCSRHHRLGFDDAANYGFHIFLLALVVASWPARVRISARGLFIVLSLHMRLGQTASNSYHHNCIRYSILPRTRRCLQGTMRRCRRTMDQTRRRRFGSVRNSLRRGFVPV